MGPDGFKLATLEHGDRVHTYAAWLLRNVAEAQDVTQEAFLRLWEHRGSVADAAARTWLLRTAHRLCLDRLRARQRQPSTLPRSLLATRDGDTPEAIAIDRDLREAVVRGLEALPVRDRAVLLLRVRYGLSHAELSTVLEMPVGTIKAALHRARARLRDQLSPLEACP